MFLEYPGLNGHVNAIFQEPSRERTYGTVHADRPIDAVEDFNDTRVDGDQAGPKRGNRRVQQETGSEKTGCSNLAKNWGELTVKCIEEVMRANGTQVCE